MNADQKAGQHRINRRSLLLGAAAGGAVGAAAIGGAWAATALRPPQVVTTLSTASVFEHAYAFTTLGTMGGPVPHPDRAQPANLLHDAEHAILIDVGDGAAAQLAKAGVALTALSTLIISHLHVDHTGGLFALLGARIQQHVPGTLVVYGPPGTRQTVAEIETAQRYLADLDHAENTRTTDLAPTLVEVHEITDGSSFVLGDVTVLAAGNTHYGFAPGSADATAFQSLSLRFDMPDRSILYTGDTGPSPAVEQLGHGVDLLVSEIIDPDEELAKTLATRSDIPRYAIPFLRRHFADQHLTAKEVGRLMQRTGAKRLVLTHNAMDAVGIARAGQTIAGLSERPLAFADDLDTW